MTSERKERPIEILPETWRGPCSREDCRNPCPVLDQLPPTPDCACYRHEQQELF